MSYMTPFEKQQLMRHQQKESETQLDEKSKSPPKIPWASDVIAKAEKTARASRPSPLLEEYMRKQFDESTEMVEH